ncbi:beta-lactamase family protein [Nonomuraea sp. NBC_01738]|uniref:serine hydrolase domain-containing protein n=1 Tax=Nonomuraea sp. NBC_01738 TaxID=2976003 RepID=UPI002E15AC1F|nr:beta-lactamase family protein [Nonomuraea sp. NBC_01738]
MRTFLALLTLLTGCASAPPAAPKQPPIVQAEADGLVAAGSQGAVVHVLDGVNTWRAAAGQARSGVPMRVTHRFRIASLTKTFTAALVMQLVAEGRLALTDRAGDLLPGVLPGVLGDVTLADLLGHTSGVHDYLTDDRFTQALEAPGGTLKTWSPKELLKYAGKKEADGYSNSNYILLGLILEKTARQPYRDLLAARLTRPFGLTATELPTDDLPRDLAHGLHTDGRDTAEIDASIFWTAGGLVATAADVATLYRRLFSGPQGKALSDGGFGIFHETLSCGRRVLTHSGMIYGYGGAAMSTEDGSRVVVVQVNSTRPGEAITAAGSLMCGL